MFLIIHLCYEITFQYFLKADNDAENFSTILEAAESSKKVNIPCYYDSKYHINTIQGKKVGTFSKDSFSGEFVDEWKNALDQSKLKQVSVLVYHVTCLLFLYNRLMSVQHLLI